MDFGTNLCIYKQNETIKKATDEKFKEYCKKFDLISVIINTENKTKKQILSETLELLKTIKF